jgi:hypothetical protein
LLQFIYRVLGILRCDELHRSQRKVLLMRHSLFWFLFVFPVCSLLAFVFAGINYYIAYYIVPFFISRLFFHCYM